MMAATATATAAVASWKCLSVLNTGKDIKFRVSIPCYTFASLKLSPASLSPLLRRQKRFFPLRPCSAAQSTELEENQEVEKMQEGEEKQEGEERLAEAGESIRQDELNQRKLFVVNLPWNYPASGLENLFGQHGSVYCVEMIKQQDGRSRGFAFVTMGSPEEAQAAIEKLDSFELAGRIIRVQLAKSFRKPSPKKPRPNTPKEETRHKVYVGNLHWKARATNLKEFFSAKFKPVSARVVFDNSSGKSGGYGFVSFDTKEEMEAVVSELDGVELLGRPLRLRIGQKNSIESQTGQDDSSQTFSEES